MRIFSFIIIAFLLPISLMAEENCKITDSIAGGDITILYPCSYDFTNAPRSITCRKVLPKDSGYIYCGTLMKLHDVFTDKGYLINGVARFGKPSKENPRICDESIVSINKWGHAHSNSQIETSWTDDIVCEL